VATASCVIYAIFTFLQLQQKCKFYANLLLVFSALLLPNIFIMLKRMPHPTWPRSRPWSVGQSLIGVLPAVAAGLSGPS